MTAPNVDSMTPKQRDIEERLDSLVREALEAGLSVEWVAENVTYQLQDWQSEHE